MRLVYCGTPDDAVAPLIALVETGHDVALVVTQPDRRRGRGSATAPSPVRAAAEGLGLPVLTPDRAGQVTAEIRASGAQLGVVVAFGQLLPDALLDALPDGFWNLHFSLLPRWRGAAPVERAILAGDERTGVCVMQIDAGLDTGPVRARRETSIAATETAGELRERLVRLGSELLVETLADPAAHPPRPQVGEATTAAKLTVEEFHLDPARPAVDLARIVRAGNPRPGAWTTVEGARLKVLRAHVAEGPDADADEGAGSPPGTIDVRARWATAAGLLVLDEVQPAGRPVMAGPAWRAGRREPLLSTS